MWQIKRAAEVTPLTPAALRFSDLRISRHLHQNYRRRGLRQMYLATGGYRGLPDTLINQSLPHRDFSSLSTLSDRPPIILTLYRPARKRVRVGFQSSMDFRQINNPLNGSHRLGRL